MTRFATLAATTALLGGAAWAQMDNPMVGGAPMLAERTIVANAVNSADHETLVAALQQADLVDTLSGSGPFTVFAPTDAAFDEIADDSLNALMMDRNRDQLAQILTCHVIADEVMASAVGDMIADDEGVTEFETVGGCTIEAELSDDVDNTITLADENGREAEITIADVRQSNGVIHVIDGVLLPSGMAG